MGLTSPQAVYEETVANFPVIMLLMFMVAGIYFMRDMLLFVFTKILLGVRIQDAAVFSILLCWRSFISFSRCTYRYGCIDYYLSGFYSVYHKVASGKKIIDEDHDHCR